MVGGRGALNLMRSLRSSLSSSSILGRGSYTRRFASSDAIQSSQSSSPAPSSPFESRLRTILRNEIQYQYDYAPPHQPVTEFDKFEVDDLPGQQWITLRGKSAEDEHIKIEATMFDGSVLDPKTGDYENEDVVRLHISMLVDIWRGEETDNMEFVCSAWPDSLEIQKVYIFKRGDSAPAPPYMGPDIKNLSNKLRTGFYEFLNERGVNSGLSRFLHQYMMNKDRIELIQWLGKLQSYIEK